ncbi:MAG: ABC transporter permease [Candidatus Thermoplasmatota archaeon]|nr:ABC transporter permease [Candidatus Thermoplasmatota archaeon]
MQHSFFGRIFRPLFEESKTLTGIMTWLGVTILIGFIFVAVAAPFIAPYDPEDIFVGERNESPSIDHIMGTDRLGRDLLSRVLWGSRTSLLIMLAAVSTALSAGLPLGLFSGYVGGRIDRALVVIMDSIYSFPGILLAIALSIALGKGILNISLAITVIYIPLYFRVIRNHVISVKQELYVEAARALGASRWTIIRSYITLNVIISIPVLLSINAADAVLTAAGLSFLGFGLEEPIADWGLDLGRGQPFLTVGVWWTSFFPGLMIIILTAGLSMLGEGLNDLINPLLRKERS